jgi:hypothetical protein
MERKDTLFSIQYSANALDRASSYWRFVENLARVMSLLSGTAAIASMASQSQQMTIVIGAIFAFMQSIEYGLSPATRAAEYRGEKKIYDELFASQYDMDDLTLEKRYLAANKNCALPRTIRELAFNDTLEQTGQSLERAYPMCFRHRLIWWMS